MGAPRVVKLTGERYDRQGRVIERAQVELRVVNGAAHMHVITKHRTQSFDFGNSDRVLEALRELTG